MMGRERSVSRRTVLAGLGAGAAALGAFPVVYGDSRPHRPLVVGHRGVAGLEAPNSMAGIRLAHEFGADGVGLDVRQTADGALVLFHDPMLDVSTDGSGRVEESTLSDLRDVRVEGQPIPTLEEALGFIAGTDMIPFLELKKTGYADAVLAALREAGLEDRAVVSSFRPETLQETQDAPVAGACLGSVPSPDLLDTAESADAEFVLSHYLPYGMGWLAEEGERRGLLTGIWELVSTEVHIEDALSFDVAVLATNRPDIALEKAGRR